MTSKNIITTELTDLKNAEKILQENKIEKLPVVNSDNQLIRFIREIYDIWAYRANISLETKQQIIPPHGTSRWFNIQYQYYSHASTKKLNNIVYNIIDTLINSGIDNQSQYLGSFYVLGALTIVNHRVAEAIPWLYQSFNY